MYDADNYVTINKYDHFDQCKRKKYEGLPISKVCFTRW